MLRHRLLIFLTASAALAGLWLLPVAPGHAEFPALSKAPNVQKTGANDVAVVVAVEKYFALPEIPGARKSAADWKSYFQDGLGVPQVFTLYDNDATREQMAKVAKRAAKASKSDGTVWWVFIGHGAPSKSKNDGMLVGVDGQQTIDSLSSRGLPQSELLGLLGQGKQKNTVVIVDACFSGKNGSGESLVPGAQPVIPVIKPTVAQNTVILSAAKADQIAGGLPGEERPAFSYLLLGALRGWGDSDKNGVVTAKEAINYTQKMLLGVKGRLQTPEFFGTGGLSLVRSAGEGDPGILDLINHGGTPPAATPAPSSKKKRTPAGSASAGSASTDSCDDGKQRASDGVNCCWAGQAWSRTQSKCVGVPSECPSGTKAIGQACIDPELPGYATIEAGSFTMGSPASEKGRQGDSQYYDPEKQRKVTITRAFWLKKTEVTQAEWKALMGSDRSTFHKYPDTHPAENMGWYKAVEYVNRLSKKEGLEACYEVGESSKNGYQKNVTFKGLSCEGYRLPTEAEWEYAARAGSKASRYGKLDAIAWHKGNWEKHSHPVAQKKPNAWGLYDMFGNVSEWTHDVFGLYQADAVTDPTGPPKPDQFDQRVTRGCSIAYDADSCRAAKRTPETAYTMGTFTGFRVARSTSP
jgi:formylglycine-generating enzyme required for sulfatase activity